MILRCLIVIHYERQRSKSGSYRNRLIDDVRKTRGRVVGCDWGEWSTEGKLGNKVIEVLVTSTVQVLEAERIRTASVPKEMIKLIRVGTCERKENVRLTIDPAISWIRLQKIGCCRVLYQVEAEVFPRGKIERDSCTFFGSTGK